MQRSSASNQAAEATDPADASYAGGRLDLLSLAARASPSFHRRRGSQPPFICAVILAGPGICGRLSGLRALPSLPGRRGSQISRMRLRRAQGRSGPQLARPRASSRRKPAAGLAFPIYRSYRNCRAGEGRGISFAGLRAPLSRPTCAAGLARYRSEKLLPMKFIGHVALEATQRFKW